MCPHVTETPRLTGIAPASNGLEAMATWAALRAGSEPVQVWQHSAWSIIGGMKGSNSKVPTIKKKIQYARMWPREIFDCDRRLAREIDILSRPGVYVLYRDDVPYYVGQASRLRTRLWQHANVPGSRYHNFWNFFSVFVPEDASRRDEIEAILIAAMPTANSAKPRLAREAFQRSWQSYYVRHDVAVSHRAIREGASNFGQFASC